jgi:hypothetical protein
MNEINILNSNTEDLEVLYRMLPLSDDSIMQFINDYIHAHPFVYATNSSSIVPDLYPKRVNDDYLQFDLMAVFKRPNVSYFHYTPDWETYTFEEILNENGVYDEENYEYVPLEEYVPPENNEGHSHHEMTEEEYEEARHNAEEAELFD